MMPTWDRQETIYTQLEKSTSVYFSLTSYNFSIPSHFQSGLEALNRATANYAQQDWHFSTWYFSLPDLEG